MARGHGGWHGSGGGEFIGGGGSNGGGGGSGPNTAWNGGGGSNGGGGGGVLVQVLVGMVVEDRMVVEVHFFKCYLFIYYRS